MRKRIGKMKSSTERNREVNFMSEYFLLKFKEERERERNSGRKNKITTKQWRI